MTRTPFNKGDKVRHAGRPEWGVGVIDAAVAITQDGRAAHRLTIMFQNAGRKTINTAFAQVVDADTPIAPRHVPADEDGAAPSGADAAPPTIDELATLPESTTDKLGTPRSHLLATLDQFRFDNTPRGMIDWSVAQSGLVDPIAHYGREELDRAFARFLRDRDKRLRDIVYGLERSGQVDVLREAIAKLDDRHKAAMREALARK
ncbi:MAG: DUF3553 domain-containing protein [Phycisphaera sp.]|nr:DUF3553 domain-containing protein [Phycisphaera sp.]